MSEDTLELGSKISLVSKAGIRYEGLLFTVDPKQCTIALSGVRSFGTENRDSHQKVPPQNNVYDYILFRASDIRDIRVIDSMPSFTHDPAIVQLSVPQPMNSQAYQQQAFNQMMHMGPPLSQYPATGYGGMAPMGNMASCLAPGMNTLGTEPRGFPKPCDLTMPGQAPPPDLSPALEPTRPNEHASIIDMMAARSRSTTPASLISGKSSTNDQGVQVTGLNKRDDKKVVQPIQPPGQRNQQQFRERNDGQNQQRNQPRPNRYNQQQHNFGQRQGGWVPRGQVRPRGRPRSAGFKHPGNQQNLAGDRSKKFEEEYDLEQESQKFEEIRHKLGKMKVEEAKPEVNGDVDKKDDSGNETGAGEGEPEEDTENTKPEVFYDKTKSFFDNISCEAIERSKGNSQRTDWKKERKLNSETFGVAATRRGNYRGRGSYGGYRGVGYRGGYRRGYYNNYNQGQRRDQSGRSGDSHHQQGAHSAAAGGSNKPAATAAPVPAPVAVKK